ncbi:hypothetical protein ACWEF6_00385 [Amycolatopsis sp. NPDC004772]
MRYEQRPGHWTIFAIDVEGYGDQRRTAPHRLALRDGLHRALSRAFDDSGVPGADLRREDCGDGVFVLAPPEIPKGPFVEFLPTALAVALHRHNRTHHPSERIRLRMALHAGEVAYDDHGVTGTAINQTFRLLEAPPLKEALKASRGVLALITSAWFFDEVVRHSNSLDSTTFRSVQVTVKETRTTGWISLPDRPYPPDTSLVAKDPTHAPATSSDTDYDQIRRRYLELLRDFKPADASHQVGDSHPDSHDSSIPTDKLILAHQTDPSFRSDQLNDTHGLTQISATVREILASTGLQDSSTKVDLPFRNPEISRVKLWLRRLLVESPRRGKPPERSSDTGIASATNNVNTVLNLLGPPPEPTSPTREPVPSGPVPQGVS